MSAEGEYLHEGADRRRTSETVAGYLSAVAIFLSLVGIAWHPLRLILPSAAAARRPGPGLRAHRPRGRCARR